MSTTSDAPGHRTLIVLGGPGGVSPRDAAGGWIYLGKTGRRDALTAAFGRPPLPLDGRLHAQARRLRRPFLDLVAELGRGRKDASAWWAGTLAWKNPAASDLFLLCCYRELCLELAGEAAPLGAERLAVVVEDPWLLRQLALDLAGRADVRGTGSLAPAILAAALLGAGRRAKWLARMLAARTRQALLSRGRREPGGARKVLLYSHLMPRSLAGGWTDHYLAGLDRELEAAGYTVVRAADTDVTGFEREVAERSGTIVPLILRAGPGAFLRAVTALPPPPAEAELEGRPVSLLLRREWWHDASRAGRCAHLLLESALDALFAEERFEACVYPWENQPQERMLLLAARRAGVRAVGCQHTTVPEMMLHLFCGRGEAEWSPLPDRLIACGPHPLAKLLEGGLPAGRLLLGGSRRYPARPPAAAAAASAGRAALALLPLDVDQGRRLLSALARVGPGSEIRVKAHPASGLSGDAAGFPSEPPDGPLAAALERCGPVVFAGTTSGVEAWLSGHPVLRFRSDTLLDVDPCDMLSDADLPTADDWSLPARLAELRERPALPGEPARRALSGLFSPVDREVWLTAVRGTC